ncbi:chaplin [Streptomyces sp. NPDC048664]|uniref:chaplin n=1 Tax=Streptomyces sp. NPDC048664 TaxID=3154505 RepID=UPI00342F9C4F
MIAAAAASGAALSVALPAHADSAANGTAAGSPGVVSGNTVQIPVHVPVNVCGNTVNVLGLLNGASGNACANQGGGVVGPRNEAGGRQLAGARHMALPRHHRAVAMAEDGGGAFAGGDATGSPGLLSGNNVKLPVDVPVNVSGNSVDVVGIGNPASGNTSTNASSTHRTVTRPAAGPVASTPEQGTRDQAQSGDAATLAHTGADATMPALAGSAVLVLGGAVLYRRFRAGSAH